MQKIEINLFDSNESDKKIKVGQRKFKLYATKYVRVRFWMLMLIYLSNLQILNMDGCRAWGQVDGSGGAHSAASSSSYTASSANFRTSVLYDSKCARKVERRPDTLVNSTQHLF